MILDQVWIKAFVLVLVHLGVGVYHPLMSRISDKINPLCSGMVLSYVFVYLMPEIGEGEDKLGLFAFIIVLGGYVLYYFLHTHFGKAPGRETISYNMKLLGVWCYSFIIVIGMPETFSQSSMHLALMTLAIALHLVHMDYELSIEYQEQFNRMGRYVLATAPVLGLFVRWFMLPDSEMLAHLLTSILAGSIIYNAMKRELPTQNRSSLAWFLGGVIIYTGLLVLVHQLQG